MTKHKPSVSTLRVLPRDDMEMVKAADLIELIGASGLTLTDRRVFNLLLRNAHGPDMADPSMKFEIDLSILRGSHGGNDTIITAIKNLMGVVVQIDADPSWDEEGIGLTHLLGDCDISSPKRKRGKMRYSFTPKMAKLFEGSAVYTRLQTDVVCAFRSKYALILYEIVSKRIGLHKQSETLTLGQFREYMGVPAGKLDNWSNLRKFCVEPAVDEVNQVAHFGVHIVPVKTGRATTGVKLMWFPKDQEGIAEAAQELARHSAGRKARRSGEVEDMIVDDT